MLGDGAVNRPHWVRQGAPHGSVAVSLRVDPPDVEPHWQHVQVNPRQAGQPAAFALPPWSAIEAVLGDFPSLTFQWRIPRTNVGNQPNTLSGVQLGHLPIEPLRLPGDLELPDTSLTLPAGDYVALFTRLWNTLQARSRWTYISPFRQVGREEIAALGQRTTARGENLANMLIRLQTSVRPEERLQYQRIRETFRNVLGLDLYATTSGNNVQLVVGDGDEGFRIPLVDSGSGLENFVAYLVHVVDQESTVVGLEEPESHLHPRAQRDMWRWLLAWARERHQFFVTTHAAIPDEVLSSSDVRVFVVDRPHPKRTTVVRSHTGPFGHWPVLGYSAGEWIGTDGVILVEGQSDTSIVSTWTRHLRPERWYRVLMAHGKGPAVAAGSGAALDQLWIPSAVVVDQSGWPRVSSGSGNVFVLDRYEIENYFLNASALARAFEQPEEHVRQLLEREFTKVACVTWALGFWDTLRLPIPDSVRSSWAEQLACQTDLQKFLHGTEDLDAIANLATRLFIAGRDGLFRYGGVLEKIRDHLQRHSRQFWEIWQNDPAILVAGKEVLRAVRADLSSTCTQADLIDVLLHDVPVPQALVDCVRFLEAQAEAWQT